MVEYLCLLEFYNFFRFLDISVINAMSQLGDYLFYLYNFEQLHALLVRSNECANTLDAIIGNN